jgi:hypothetical protein
MRGTALCGDVEVYDEGGINDQHGKYVKKRIVIADLPVCKKCVRKAGAR